MQRRPPSSTRTDTLFPYTTLFRSLRCYHLRTAGGDYLVPHEFVEHRSGPVGLAEIDRRINRVALKVERFGARGEIDREPRSLRCKLPQTRREPGGSEGREDGEIEGAVLAFAPGVDHRAR